MVLQLVGLEDPRFRVVDDASVAEFNIIQYHPLSVCPDQAEGGAGGDERGRYRASSGAGTVGGAANN